MARMSREFSLVLLGAGVLTAGYFLWPEEDLHAKAEREAEQQVAGNNANGTHRTHHGGMFIFMPMGGGRSWSSSTGGRSPAMASVSRGGGFGSFGHAASGGS